MKWWVNFNEGSWDHPGWPVVCWYGRSFYLAFQWRGEYHRWCWGPRFKAKSRSNSELIDAMQLLLTILELHTDQRLQGYPQNAVFTDWCRYLLKRNPLMLGKTPEDLEAVKRIFAEPALGKRVFMAKWEAAMAERIRTHRAEFAS